MLRLNRTSIGLFLAAGSILFAFSRAEARVLDASVPFTSQAPTAEWKNRVYQDGCEEASMLMANAWARGKPITKKIAFSEINAITAYEGKLFGGFVADTSAEDTARAMRGYFRMRGIIVRHGITASGIIAELKKGTIVLVPVNGRLLRNPNYTQPGPERHMLVVRGYDDIRLEFITNDPGTRKGEGYRYKKSILFAAIRDYPTGNHKTADGRATKAMVIVSR